MRMERREFLIRALRLLGLPAGLGVAKAFGLMGKILPNSEEEKLIEAFSSIRLFEHEAEQVLRAFHDAPSGTLQMYYQLFWPIFITQDEWKKVGKIEQLYKETRDRAHEFPRWHRIRALPAVAAAHALASVSPLKADALREIIFRTSQEALDVDKDPHREVLEIVWQNMTTALIRNPESWDSFNVGDLISHAQEICFRFLLLHPENSLLLFAAAQAWQFLLTYERAVAGRPGATENLAKIQSAIDKVKSHASPHLVWLTALERLYENRTSYVEMLPQQTEIVMGRRLVKIPFPEASELFTLMRLQMQYNNRLIADGALASPYMRDRKRAADVAKGSLAFLAMHGSSMSDEWVRLKNWAQSRDIPLSRDIVQYYNNLPPQRWKESELERKNIIELAHWIPFARLDEQSFAKKLLDPKLLANSKEAAREVAKLVIEGNKDNQVWSQIVAYTAAQEAIRKEWVLEHDQDELDKLTNAVKEAAEEDLSKLRKQTYLAEDVVREVAVQFIYNKTMVGFGPAVGVGTVPLQKEEIMVPIHNKRGCQVEDGLSNSTITTKELTWANVNLDDPEERSRFFEQEDCKARIRVKNAVKRLQEEGIIDARGQRIKKELPNDMQTGSKCIIP